LLSFVPLVKPLVAFGRLFTINRGVGGLDRSIALLSDRERQVLALLARSHDAKSIARTLNLSIHTVNEQLRAARHKLGVTSSREAARRLLEHEGGAPKVLGNKALGIERKADGSTKSAQPELRALLLMAGACLMILIALLALALWNERHGTTPTALPSVVATRPRNGSTIAPGPFLLSVTFDQPMMPGYSFVQISPETMPNCAHQAGQSPDQRSFTMRCTAVAGKKYEAWLNRPPFMNFRGVSGDPAQPERLHFSVRTR